MARFVNIAQLIPPKVRQAIYSVLGTLFTLELIFDWLPEVWEGRVLQVLAVLGFSLAAGNVTKASPAAQGLAASLVVAPGPAVAPAPIPVPNQPAPDGFVPFASKRRADVYATAAWMRVLRSARRPDGTLVNQATGQGESVGLTWPDDDGLEFYLRTLPADAYNNLVASFVNYPVVIDGETRTEWWAPELDSSGRWLVRRAGG